MESFKVIPEGDMSKFQKPIELDKSILRKKYLEIRKSLSPEKRNKLSTDLLDIFKSSFDLDSFNIVHCFLPIERQSEVNTNLFMDYLIEQQINIAISKSDLESNDLTHFIYDDSVILSKNKWGILEPEPESGRPVKEVEIDMVLVPLTIFDKQGNRLGYGKGYYDKFLSLCKPNCVKIGLSLLEAVQTTIPTESTDIKLDYCISPSGLHTYNTSTE